MSNLGHRLPLGQNRTTAHRATRATRPFDLRGLIANYCMKLGGVLNGRGYYLAINLSPSLPRFFVGDPLLIQDLLNNIIHNGLKSLHEGGMLISIQSERLSAREHTVFFVVTVSGEEIPGMMARRIFSSCGEWRADGRHDGMPNLSIAKMITTTLGGDMVISHNGGWGTIYTASINLHLHADSVTN